MVSYMVMAAINAAKTIVLILIVVEDGLVQKAQGVWTVL